MKRITNFSWWEWDAVYSLLFCKWPQLYQAWAREGQPNYAIDNFPKFFLPQDPAKTEEDRTKMKNNVENVRKSMYSDPGIVLSLTQMFYVRKGLNNIRMVYNGTLCNLNLDLWAPHFGLPIVQHTLRALLPRYSKCDMDVGEIFLNLPLHPEFRLFAGVDITHIKSSPDEEGWDQDRTRVWERWAKNFMGLTDYPYQSLQLLIHVKFISYGERNYPLNPFQWSHANLNMTGDESYTPKLPWATKVREDGHLESEVFIYVDDGRIISHSELVCFQVENIFGSICNSLGIQYASRKRTYTSLTPGPWAGTVAHT